jgi:CRP-like cAMP-binding protein
MRKVLYIFGLLTDADVEWMAAAGTQRRLKAGELIIREGDRTDSLVFLLEGGLVVSNKSMGELARMGVGEVVGEMSLVDSAPPSATITASRDGLAFFLDRAKLLKKLEADDGFGSRFYRALAIFLADRLRDARRSPGTRTMDEMATSDDELDVGILDHVTSAGERFSRMLKTLSSNRPAN